MTVSNLIEELRSVAKRYTAGINPDSVGGRPEHYIQWQAADEIERLRKALREIKMECPDYKLTDHAGQCFQSIRDIVNEALGDEQSVPPSDPGIGSHEPDCRCAHCWSIREARKLVKDKP